MLHTKYLGFVVSDKKTSIVFSYISICKTYDPWVGPILAPGASFALTWYRSTRYCYIPIIKALRLAVSDKTIFFMISLYKPM